MCDMVHSHMDMTWWSLKSAVRCSVLQLRARLERSALQFVASALRTLLLQEKCEQLLRREAPRLRRLRRGACERLTYVS